MTAFAYSTGTPTNIAGANTATMADIKNSFADVATYVNGGNLDATYMSPAVFAPYRTIESRNVNVYPSDLNPGLGSKWYVSNGTYFKPASTLANLGPLGIQFNPVDHLLTGKTLSMRLVVATAFPSSAPASLTFGLYPVSFHAGSGSFDMLMGDAAATITRAPAASNNYVDSVTFSALNAGAYVFGAPAVTINEAFTVAFRLEIHWA